jgi:putative membrane protein insertion efficiency factor
VKKALLGAITWYKKTEPVRNEIARNLSFPVNNCCFKPTCSEYMYDAVEKYGVMKGFVMGMRRFFRCNPWSKGGYDPVK